MGENISLKSLSPSYYTRISEVKKRIEKRGRLLDAGCSDGYLDYLIKDRRLKIFGVDINETDIQIAKELNPENKYLVCDITKMPFKSNYFDTIVCIDVLEHLENDEKAIREITRVLKEGGKAILTVPSLDYPFTFDPLNYILKYFNKKVPIGVWGYGHKRLYCLEMIKNLLYKKLKILEVFYLSHAFTGIFSNSYIENLLQPFVKSDPENNNKIADNINALKKMVKYKPPLLLTKIRDSIIHIDKFLFKDSKQSLGLLIVAEK